MSVVVLTSAGHSPGVTTAALGFALSWPRPVVLVDADPHPSQSVLAGYLQGEDPFGTGLWTVLAAHRERRPLAAAVASAVLELPTGDGVARRFLPGFSNPGMVDLFGPVWPDFVVALAEGEADVIVDVGRVGNRGLPPALAAEADLVLVVTRTSLVDLVGLRLYLPLLTAVAPERTGLLLVGPGRPYTAKEISGQFGVEVVDAIPWAPLEAQVLSHGGEADRGFPGGTFSRGVRKAADGVADRLAALQQRIGVPR